METTAVSSNSIFLPERETLRPAHAVGARMRVAIIAFGAMALIVLTNLNGFVSVRFGREQFFSPVLAVAGIIIMLSTRRISTRMGSAGALFIVFLLCYLVIGFLRRDPIRELEPAEKLLREYAVSLFIILPVAIMTAISWERRRWPRLIIGLFAIGMFTVAGVFVSIWLGGDMYVYAVNDIDTGRYGGVFVNPNEAGIACTIIALFGFASLTEVKRKWPVVLGLVACVVANILTFSRGSLLTFLVVMATSYAVTSWRFDWRLIVGIVLVGALISVAALTDVDWATWLRPDQRDRLADVVNLITTGNVAAAGGSDRRWLAQVGFQEWMESPLVGNGLGTQRSLRAAGTGPHNQYLLLLGDSGVLPAAIYCAVLVAMFLTARRSRRDSVRIFLAGYAALILILGFHNHNILENRLCNFGFGIAFGLCGIQWQRLGELKRSAPAAALQVAAGTRL